MIMMNRMTIMEEEEITYWKKTEAQKNIKTLLKPQNILRKTFKA
jgi:hypothetical protein